MYKIAVFSSPFGRGGVKVEANFSINTFGLLRDNCMDQFADCLRRFGEKVSETVMSNK